ncbi:MAG: hypothetical protein ACOC5R_06145, partial [Elusimicrobiota bacterium]
LTYRQELRLNTSDLDPDSDNDGIIDSKDTHPAGEGRNIPQTFTWSYGGYTWEWTEFIQEDWYDYYKAKTRSSHPGIDYVTSNDPFIKKIAEEISDKERGDINKTWLAISFVQSLPYVDDVFTGYNEYPKYPVETFFEKNGDCEDVSYLAASIIDAMNIATVLVVLPGHPGHMAIGVWMDCDSSGTYYEIGDRCYYYVETTTADVTSREIFDRYKSTKATLIKVPSGKTVELYPKYNNPCYPAPDFPGYYSDGEDYYSDSHCNHGSTCLPYEEFYFNYKEEEFYWDSSCGQIVVEGCLKSDSYS